MSDDIDYQQILAQLLRAPADGSSLTLPNWSGTGAGQKPWTYQLGSVIGRRLFGDSAQRPWSEQIPQPESETGESQQPWTNQLGALIGRSLFPSIKSQLY